MNNGWTKNDNEEVKVTNNEDVLIHKRFNI